jgi:adenylyltransferase/sulfurtransferase
MPEQHMERYSRQILFQPIGRPGQERLLASRVVIIGQGALGTVIADHLARAGVGHLVLVDRDFVELSNLQRQSLFDEEDAHQRLPKAIAAARKLARVNSEIEIAPLIADVTPRNVEELIAGANLVMDATDNLETRLLLNDACLKAGIPWIYGGAVGSSGIVMSIVPGETPCLRCLIDEPPPPGVLPSCDTVGVLNATTATVASIQTAEALKLLTGHAPAAGVLYLDVWEGTFDRMPLERRPDCPACVQRNFEYLAGARTAWTTVLCGRNAVQIVPPDERGISLEDLAGRLANVGRVTYNGFLLSLEVDGRELVIFPTGRAIIKGTTDEAEARTLYARYIGT